MNRWNPIKFLVLLAILASSVGSAAAQKPEVDPDPTVKIQHLAARQAKGNAKALRRRFQERSVIGEVPGVDHSPSPRKTSVDLFLDRAEGIFDLRKGVPHAGHPDLEPDVERRRDLRTRHPPRQRDRQEREARAEFGEAYDRYAATTPGWIPWLGGTPESLDRHEPSR